MFKTLNRRQFIRISGRDLHTRNLERNTVLALLLGFVALLTARLLWPWSITQLQLCLNPSTSQSLTWLGIWRAALNEAADPVLLGALGVNIGALVLGFIAAWYLLSAAALICLASARRWGHTQMAMQIATGVRRFGAPFIRTCAVTSFSALLITTSALAHAGEPNEGGPIPAAPSLAPHLPVTALAPSPALSASSFPALTLPQHNPAPQHTGAFIDVHAGDSLWSLAANLLNTSDPQRIDLAWRQLYAANRAVIGNDPNLITPTMQLIVPEELKQS